MQQIPARQRAGSPSAQHAAPQRRTAAAKAHHRIPVTAGGDRHPTALKITQGQLMLLRQSVRELGSGD